MSAPTPEPEQPTTFLEYVAFVFLALLVFLGGCGVERWLG